MFPFFRQEARRKSLCASGRSKSLGHRPSSAARRRQRRRGAGGSSLGSAGGGSTKTGGGTPEFEDFNNRARTQSNGGGGGGGGGSGGSVLLSAFKTKYSQSVVGYGAENCSWSFLLSLPHLIMVSNLQVRADRKYSQPSCFRSSSVLLSTAVSDFTSVNTPH